MNIIPFQYAGNEIRTIMLESEPWWVAKDVCWILEISRYRDAVARLDADERGSVLVDTLGGLPRTYAIF